MNKKITVLTLCAMLFALSYSASAQQPMKVPRIGYLSVGTASDMDRIEAVRQGLRELGYVEGKNIAFESRYGDNKHERLPALADELVRLKVDVLLANGTSEARAAKHATRTIPIVFFAVTDPVAAELIDSLARPGGNLTGFTTIGAVLAGKRLELLKETVPKLSRVAVLWDPQIQGSAQEWKESQLPAREFGLQLHSMEVSSTDKFENAFKETAKARSGALVVIATPLAFSNQKRIVDLATKNQLPAIYHRGDWVARGGLMSYGADQNERFRRGAVMVDKILKGAKPADLPVEQPTKFELAINLKSAKQIGLTIPPNVLVRADKVIK